MFGAIVVLLILPFLNSSKVRSPNFRPIFRVIYWLFVADFLLLGWVGQKVVETPYIEVGQLFTVIYFMFFLVVTPLLGFVESKLMSYKI
jgi:quinol-cytochrome oxidoreductase complex cytochrome b subunit